MPVDKAPWFLPRLWMAIVCFVRILFRKRFAAALLTDYRRRKALSKGEIVKVLPEEAAPVEVAVGPAPPTERRNESALAVLGMLQREGRLIDFLQEDVAPFTDEEVGAAARVVHEGCRKVVREHLELSPVMEQAEGDSVSIPTGFDASRVRLTGNVQGDGPFKGTLRHRGWQVKEARLPSVSEAVDPSVLAPAEVELP